MGTKSRKEREKLIGKYGDLIFNNMFLSPLQRRKHYFSPFYWRHYPASRAAFDLPRKIEGGSARRVWRHKFDPEN